MVAELVFKKAMVDSELDEQFSDGNLSVIRTRKSSDCNTFNKFTKQRERATHSVDKY